MKRVLLTITTISMKLQSKSNEINLESKELGLFYEKLMNVVT